MPQGLELIRSSENVRDAIRPLRKQAPPDLVCATQLASAADWARIYLLSGLADDVVDELFLTPVSNETEVRRLLKNDCALPVSGSGAVRPWYGAGARSPGCCRQVLVAGSFLGAGQWVKFARLVFARPGVAFDCRICIVRAVIVVEPAMPAAARAPSNPLGGFQTPHSAHRRCS